MGIKTVVRSALGRVAKHYGYEMRIIGSPPRGYSNFLRQVVDGGMLPKTVFDVGVATGTPWLYDAFPDAHFVLIEPQKEFEPALQDICKRMDAEYHLVGVGSSERYQPIYRLLGSPTGSSFLRPNLLNEKIWGASETSEDLHIIPLDTYHTLPGPFFLKIDTEGYELDVLRGAAKVLAKTDVVLMEVAITQRQLGEPGLIEIGSFMESRGFRLIDFPVLSQRGSNGPLIYVDVAFARIGSSLAHPDGH
jgi:FkbM family methyltransferase